MTEVRPHTAQQLWLDAIPRSADPAVSTFSIRENGGISRTVLRRDGSSSVSDVEGTCGAPKKVGERDFDQAWLRATDSPQAPTTSEELAIADLFSGCGGLTLGLSEACRALGIEAHAAFSADLDSVATAVYRENFRPRESSTEPLELLVDGDLGSRPTPSERELIASVGKVDFVIAGPPCQGHSDLNNHTRRDDPKNRLVERVARFAELFEPRFVLVENVPGIRHDRTGAFVGARRALKDLGYSLDQEMFRADDFGVPQTRKRFFLVAGRDGVWPLSGLRATSGSSAPDVRWAIEDLLAMEGETVFDTPSTHSADNRRRIEYLFEKKLHDLPDSERPQCHQGGGHSYKSVYGRMHWDRPAPTLTRGFGSTGQGRFVHPRRPRTLTPHEAARIQFFPDFFDFGSLGRRQYQSLIGNAVPSKLAYAIGLHLLR